MANDTTEKKLHKFLNFFSELNNEIGKDDTSIPLYSYVYYTRSFSEKERKIIENFRKDFLSKKEDIITILEKKDDYDKKVIMNFIEWLEQIPTQLCQLKEKAKEIPTDNKEQIKQDEVSTQSKNESLNDTDIDSYIKNRWKGQRNYFDKKANTSQKKYRLIQRWLIILSALSTLVISLNLNDALKLYPTKEQRQQEQLYEKCENSYNYLKGRYKDFKPEDQAFFNTIPAPTSDIANKDIVFLNDYYQNINQILLKYNESDECGIKIFLCNKLVCSILDWIYEKVWWNFLWWLQGRDVEKGLCAIISFVMVLLTGINRLMNYYDEWHRNRENCEKLNRELYNYNYKVGAYKLKKGEDIKKNTPIFVDRVETIINDYMKDMLSEKDKFAKQQSEEETGSSKTNGQHTQNVTGDPS